MSDYDSKTVEELREEAAEKDIEGRSSMNKAELVAALSGDSGPSADRNPSNSSTEGDRSGKGEPPEVANEGGVTKEGTGDFAPGSSGSTLTVEIGADGVNPVSPQNPPRKAMLGGGNAETNPDAVARNEGVDITSDLEEERDAETVEVT